MVHNSHGLPFFTSFCSVWKNNLFKHFLYTLLSGISQHYIAFLNSSIYCPSSLQTALYRHTYPRLLVCGELVEWLYQYIRLHRRKDNSAGGGTRLSTLKSLSSFALLISGVVNYWVECPSSLLTPIANRFVGASQLISGGDSFCTKTFVDRLRPSRITVGGVTKQCIL